MKLEPLVFAEDRHAAIWGCERWLVSAHPAAPSVVASGAFAGMRLDELAARYGDDLYGTRAGGRFPVLVKDILANDRLSVQVHPSEKTARPPESEPKTELWYVLESSRGGGIIAGAVPGVTRDALQDAIRRGRAEDLLPFRETGAGEFIFIPGGLVHALCGGVRVLEVQQPSVTTYRLYDWNRTDASGRPRELHVEAGLAAADLSLAPVYAKGGFESRFFRIREFPLSSSACIPADPETFRVFFAADGSFTVASDAGRLEVAEHGAVLLPAACSAELEPSGGASAAGLVEITV